MWYSEAPYLMFSRVVLHLAVVLTKYEFKSSKVHVQLFIALLLCQGVETFKKYKNSSPGLA